MTETTTFKKRKTLKITLIALAALIVLLLVGLLMVWIMSGRPSFGRVENITPPITIDTSDFTGFAVDALYLVQTIERTHPIFIVDGWLPYNYEIMRDEFLLYAQNPNITRLDFVFAAKHFITVLRDGHMSGMMMEVCDEGRLQRIIHGGTLDINWIAQDGNLFLHGEQVKEVGGVSVAQVLATVDRYYYSENEADRQFNHARFSRYGDVIERAGGEIKNGTVTVLIQNEDNTATITVPLSFERVSQDFDFIIRYEMLDDIFFIDLRTFVMGDHITETVKAIEQAVANGTRKFIVDLRGNGGGNSLAGQRLLEAMDITIPQFGAVRRISPLPIATHSHLWDMRLLSWFGYDYMRFNPSVVSNSNPNDVFVSVLTDVESYSSANMMATWVQDGGFGNIIGSPSRQAPTNFGDVIWYSLPHSGIWTNVSFTHWLRPDAQADQTTLWPDIIVDPVNALEVAVEYLRNLGR